MRERIDRRLHRDDPTFHRPQDMETSKSDGVLEWWNIGVVEDWGDGVRGWSIGVLEDWSGGGERWEVRERNVRR